MDEQQNGMIEPALEEKQVQINIEEKLPLSKNLVMGLQHVLTMFPGSIAVPLILGNALGLNSATTATLIATTLFTSALAILIQVIGIGKNIGSRSPIILGSAFAPLGPMIAIGHQYNLAAIFGAVIGSGILLFIVSFFMDKIVCFFPPVVVGTFVTIIGVTLAPTAFTDLAGGNAESADFGSLSNLIVGLAVLLIIILLSHFGSELIKTLSLLIGLICGTLLAIPFGMVNLSSVQTASWFKPVLPFQLGMPEFHLGAILIMTVFCLINVIQSFGAFAFLDEVLQTKPDQKKQVNGIKGQALSQIFSGVFNAFPSSMFNENIGIIKLSRIGARSTIVMASILLVIISFSPKLCAVVTCIPKPVIGGATLGLFGTISAAGVSILSSVDFNDNANSLIVGTGLALGVGANFTSAAFQQLPETLSMLLSNGLFVVAFTTIILNFLLHNKSFRKKKD